MKPLTCCVLSISAPNTHTNGVHTCIRNASQTKVASLAIKDMPWTYRSAILMGLVQFAWCGVAAIAALGSFIALEKVTAPDGTSHPAIKCLDNFDLDDMSTGSSCTCSGTKISDVREGERLIRVEI